MSAHPHSAPRPGSLTGDRMRSPTRFQIHRPTRQWAWWNRHRHYQIYMLRELSAVFSAIWAFNQIRQLNHLRRGEGAYQSYVRQVRSPGWVFLNGLGLGFLLLHAITWWRLLGGLDLVKLGDRKASPEQVTTGAFGAWGVVNLLLGLILLFGGRRRS